MLTIWATILKELLELRRDRAGLMVLLVMPMALDLAETRDVLARLLNLLRAGAFPHAVQKDDCRYCDYEAVCGGPIAAAKRAKAKVAKTSLPVLRAFWDIHGEG